MPIPEGKQMTLSLIAEKVLQQHIIKICIYLVHHYQADDMYN